MILDDRNEFADAVSCNTGAAGTYNIGDLIDLGATQRSIGAPRSPLYFVVTVDTGIKVASSTGTIQFQLVSDGTSTIATDASQTVHVASRAFATSTTSDVGALAAGTVLLQVQVPTEGLAYERYLGVQQVTGTTAISAGKVNAFLTPTPSAWKSYDAPWQA